MPMMCLSVIQKGKKKKKTKTKRKEKRKENTGTKYAKLEVISKRKRNKVRWMKTRLRYREEEKGEKTRTLSRAERTVRKNRTGEE